MSLAFISFILALVGAILFASGVISASSQIVFFISILILAVGVYATRSLYFAVMQSGKIPVLYTGTAVGLISVIGYTPDIFSGPIVGLLLDNNPGELGHQYVFLMMAGFCVVGTIAAFLYHKEFSNAKK